MQQVGLLETRYHAHVLYYIARIANSSDTSVTVFTTESIYDEIADQLTAAETDIKLILKDPEESEGEYLTRIEPICDQELDVLIVNTISGSAPELYNFVRFNPDCPKLLWIYNVRTWLEPKLSVPRNLKTFFDHNSRTLFYRLILRNYDGLLVQYSPWKTYIDEETDYNGPVYAFPRVFYENDAVTKRSEVTVNKKKITVPGIILDKRDYDMALDTFVSLSDEANVELCMLGSIERGSSRSEESYSERIFDRCVKLEAKGFDIKYYEGWVPEEEFKNQLQQSDVILSPLKQIPKQRNGYVELHGQTTGTGAIFAALGHGKPLVLPEEYVIGDEIADLTYQYSSATDFTALLKRFATEDAFLLSAKQRSYKVGQNFTLKKQRQQFGKILKDFLKRV